MIFSLFLFWEYSDTAFNEMKNRSVSTPILALCHSPHCPHCIDVRKTFQELIKETGSRRDFATTMINCDNTKGCSRVNAKGTPTLLLIIGPRRVLWPKPTNYSKEWLLSFVERHIPPNINSQPASRSIMSLHRQKSPNSVFEFYSSPLVSKSESYYKNISRIWVDENITFHITQRLKTIIPTVVSHLSAKCSITTNAEGTELLDWIDTNKYSIYHAFTYKELKKQMNRKPMIVLLDNSTDRAASRWCQTFTFGTISRSVMHDFLQENRIKNVYPQGIVTNPVTSCASFLTYPVWHKKSASAITQTITGRRCDVKIRLMSSSKNVQIQFSNTVNGVLFMVWFYTIGLTLIAIIRRPVRTRRNTV